MTITKPTIKPISDLKDYDSVLKDVTATNPVYLTRDGRGAYALVDISALERFNAAMTLMAELEEGEESARKRGWISLADSRTAVQELIGKKRNAR